MQNMHNELYSFHLDLLVLVYVYVCIFIQFFFELFESKWQTPKLFSMYLFHS